jgi:hypothetical protein
MPTFTEAETPDPKDRVHEFMVLSFEAGIGGDQQLAIMEALGHHLLRCEGLIDREFFRSDDGQWVEQLVWASQANLDASAGTCEDAVGARSFDCFDTRSVAYLRGVRVDAAGLGTSGAEARLR